MLTRFVYWHCSGVGKALLCRNNSVLMDENRNDVATMLNRSSDLRGRMKLAKFRLFIYAKLKPNKIHRNMYISVESPESEN